MITTLRLAIYSIVKAKLYILFLLLELMRFGGHLLQQCTHPFLIYSSLYFISTASFGAKLYPTKPLS